MLDIDAGNRFAVVLVVVGLFALALTASTITSVEAPAGGDEGLRIDVGGGDNLDTNRSVVGPSSGDGGQSATSGIRITRCIDFLTTPLAVGGIFGGFVLVLYGIYRRFNLATSVFTSFVIGPLTFGTWAMLTNCVTSQRNTDGLLGGGSFAVRDGGIATAPPVSPMLLGAVFAVLVVLSLAVMVSVTGGEETYEPVEDDFEEPAESDFARAAGRAADRIEAGNVPVDNAVYRAWAEMTNLLDLPNPETSTPMDFADAAVEFGLAEADVRELTELFNEVRYGHRSAAEREARAVEVLRNIEATYEATAGDVSDRQGGDAS